MGIALGSTFDDLLTSEYTQTNESNAQFGKTVLRFADGDNNVQHGAVFYGKSQDGTTYVYSKNGWYIKPEIMKLSDYKIKFPVMVQLKALMAGVVIISLTLVSFHNRNSFETDRVSNMKQDVIMDDTILLKETDYNIIFRDSDALNIKISNTKTLDRIKNTKSPIFNIEVDKEFIIAKGNNILASSLPIDCNYFYPLNSKGMVVMKDGLINFRKINSQ